MPCTKTGIVRHRRHKEILKLTKGYRGAASRLYKHAKEASLHAGQYAYIGRKLRERDFRRLWISRITAGLKSLDATFQYSRFIAALKKAQIGLDRKILADLAVKDSFSFKAIVEAAGYGQK